MPKLRNALGKGQPGQDYHACLAFLHRNTAKKVVFEKTQSLLSDSSKTE